MLWALILCYIRQGNYQDLLYLLPSPNCIQFCSPYFVCNDFQKLRILKCMYFFFLLLLLNNKIYKHIKYVLNIQSPTSYVYGLTTRYFKGQLFFIKIKSFLINKLTSEPH